MLLSEPPRSEYDLEFKLFGIPVRVHWTFWLMTILLGSLGSSFDVMRVLLWTAAVFLSILWHELGHAFAILYYGERPWIVLYSFGGLACHVPTGRSRRADPMVRSVMISLGGPMNQLLLAAAIVGGLFATGYSVEMHGMFPVVDFALLDRNLSLYQFVQSMLYINVFWAVLNLAPIWPLDGGQVVGAVATRANPRDGFRIALVTSIVTAIAVAIFVAYELKSTYSVIFFAYLAFENYQRLQAENFRRW